MIISINGPMAVGKTYLLETIRSKHPNNHFVFENAIGVNTLFDSIHNRKSDCFSISLKQMLFINDFIERLSDKKTTHKHVFVDKGIENFIVFWNQRFVESSCEDKSICASVQALTEDFGSDIKIFLDASDDVLRSRMENDSYRSRGFYDEYMLNHVIAEREYFKHQGAKVIDTTNMTKLDVYTHVSDYLKSESVI